MKFVIFSFARCGSTNLMNLLNSQGANLNFEPYSPIFQKEYYKIAQNNFIESLNLLENKFDGFKHLSMHLNKEQNIEILKRFKIIYLYRKDLIKSAISLALARTTKVYKKTAISPDYYEKKYELNPDIVIEIAKQARMHLKYITFLKDSHIISYEDLFENSETKETYARKILQYCGLSVVDESKFRYFLDGYHKLNYKLEDRIKNYHELMDYIVDKIYK